MDADESTLRRYHEQFPPSSVCIRERHARDFHPERDAKGRGSQEFRRFYDNIDRRPFGWRALGNHQPFSEMPISARTILMVWSLKRKRFPDGRLNKHKARVCAHGGMQQLDQHQNPDDYQ